MTVEIENPANSVMHYGTNVFVKDLVVPDKLPANKIYSAAEADAKFNQIQRDIYEGERKAKPIETTKFPMVLKILLGIGGTFAMVFKGKTILRALKNIILR